MTDALEMGEIHIGLELNTVRVKAGFRIFEQHTPEVCILFVAELCSMKETNHTEVSVTMEMWFA
jgi:hypothetical protein